VLSGGPMLDGWWQGRLSGSGTIIWEARKLHAEALETLERIVREKWVQANGAFGLFPAARVNGDDIEIYEDESRKRVAVTVHNLRQQNQKPTGRANQCLADLVAPKEAGVPDWIGAFAVSVGGFDARLAQFEAQHDDYGAIMLKVLADRLNLLGPYNDDPKRSTAIGTRHVSLEQRNFGEFKVPSLRNLESSMPYMHNGSLAGLRDVVKHYSEISRDRLHSDGEAILKPLHLTDAETADLVAFLETLSDRGGQYKRRPFPEDCR